MNEKNKPEGTKATYMPDIHRPLPSSPEAEMSALSSTLLAPPAVFGMWEERNASPEWFHVPAHQTIFEVMLDRWQRKLPIDFMLLTEDLRDRGVLDLVGGAAFVTSLFTLLPTAANAAYYLEILAEKFAARQVIRVCTDYASRAYDAKENIGELVDECQTQVLQLTRPDSGAVESIRQIREGVHEAVAAIEEMYHTRGGVTGLPTGFKDLDRMTGGLKPGQLVIVAGRPSMGKSALMWQFAEHISMECGLPVLGFSLEMTLRELASRMLCGRGGINLQRVRDGFLSEQQMGQTLPAAAMDVAKAPIWIDETPGLSIQELRARARRFVKKYPKTACIVIDYLQLMKSTSRRASENRALEIAEISGGLKNLGKELGLPVIAGAQLNRDNDGPKSPPKLSNLRESGSIEQDADVALLLHRVHYYTKKDEDKGKATANLAKQRNGPTGDVHLVFRDELGRFENPDGRQLYSNDDEERQHPGDE